MKEGRKTGRKDVWKKERRERGMKGGEESRKEGNIIFIHSKAFACRTRNQ